MREIWLLRATYWAVGALGPQEIGTYASNAWRESTDFITHNAYTAYSECHCNAAQMSKLTIDLTAEQQAQSQTAGSNWILIFHSTEQ